MILIVANRGQYNHRIYRTLRDLGVESNLVKNNIALKELKDLDIQGIVIGGGPFLNEAGNSQSIIEEYHQFIPILGICLGHQIMAKTFGGEVRQAEIGEYAEAKIIVEDENILLRGVGDSFKAWVSHRDEVKKLPENFKRLAYSDTCPIEAMAHTELPLYGVQFHPEVEHTSKGPMIFKNFLALCK